MGSGSNTFRGLGMGGTAVAPHDFGVLGEVEDKQGRRDDGRALGSRKV